MLRPPRSRGRFQGNAEGATSLSNPYAEADGRRLRRRYCVYFCLTVILIIGIIFAVKGGSKESGVNAPAPAAPPGSYVQQSQSVIPEIKSKVTVYKHKKSAMNILAVLPEDASQDAVFGISFRTKATDHSGIAYVVSKAIQDGSKNIPIKDPFNQLKRGSLQTHMDAWVEKDRSGFVYASRNKVDFRNGMRVYLDGIFKPNLMSDDHNWIFRQEAWRLVPVGQNDEKIALSGNAVNDAKVEQMNPASAHEDYIYKTLFQGHQYEWMEKGDFRDIVTLTRTKMKDFYTKHYHPSNGNAFCFGPQDFIDECLNLMEPYLSEYNADDKIHKNSEVTWVPLSDIKSIKDSVPYPSYQDSGDYRLGISYVLNDQPMDDRTKIAWHIIEDLLIGGPTAVVQQTISKGSLGDDAIGGLQSKLRQWILTIGVSGVPSEDLIDIGRLQLQKEIIRIAADGFDDAAVKATLNKLDLKFRERNSNGVPRGVSMFKDVLTTWNYDEDPRIPLSYSKIFTTVKQEIETNGQGFLLQLMTRCMVDNNRILVTEMYPSTSLLTLYKNQEYDWLSSLDQYLTQEQGQAILAEGAELKEIQARPDSHEALEAISTLTVSDLRAMSFEIPNKVFDDVFDSGITMLQHEVPHTNGIAYVDYSIDISNMDFADVVLLPLLCQLLIRGGTSIYSGTEMQRSIDLMTGGITLVPIVEEIVSVGSNGGYLVPDGKHMVTKIVVRASCLASTGCLPMFNIIRQIVFDSNVQQQSVVIEVLKKMIDDMEDDIQIRPHEYSTIRIQSQYGLPGFIREQWLGMTQLFNLRRALIAAQNDWSTLSNRLVLMADAMRKGNRNGMALSLTGDKESIKGVAKGLELFCKDILPGATQTTRFPDWASTVHPWYTSGMKMMADEINAEGENEAFIVPTRLNAIAKGGLLYEPGEPVSGSDLVVLQYIGGYFLYQELRFGKGASDAKAVFDIDTGSVTYQSNDDPDILSTLDVFEEGASFVLRETQGKSSLPPEAEGAVIGVIGQMDGTAMFPSEIGFASLVQWLKHDSTAARQRFRDQVLGSNVNNFMDMVNRLGAWGKPTIAVITNQEFYAVAEQGGLVLSKCDYTGTAC